MSRPRKRVVRAVAWAVAVHSAAVVGLFVVDRPPLDDVTPHPLVLCADFSVLTAAIVGASGA